MPEVRQLGFQQQQQQLCSEQHVRLSGDVAVARRPVHTAAEATDVAAGAAAGATAAAAVAVAVAVAEF